MKYSIKGKSDFSILVIRVTASTGITLIGFIFLSKIKTATA
jgi:hypothetical protein